MMSKSFFFGLVTVYDWEWLWGRTAAQIELRTLDQPVIVYKAEKNKEKPWKDGTVSESYAQKALRKWQEGKKKREKEGIKFDMSKVRKIDMGEFLRTGNKVDLD